jgi:hypothetical protein
MPFYTDPLTKVDHKFAWSLPSPAPSFLHGLILAVAIVFAAIAPQIVPTTIGPSSTFERKADPFPNALNAARCVRIDRFIRVATVQTESRTKA